MIELRSDSIPEDEYAPIDAGWDARLEGKSKNCNPYAINNWKHYHWEKGWKEADEAIENE